MLYNSKRVRFINKIVYIYRLRKNSIMSSKNNTKDIDGYINSYKIIYNTNGNNINDYNDLLFKERILD